MEKIVIMDCETQRLELVQVKKKDFDLIYMQKVVGGIIDIPYISEQLDDMGIDTVINDEGKLLGLPINFVIVNGTKVCDFVVGNVLFCGHDDEGNSIGLNKEQLHFLDGVFNQAIEFPSKDGLRLLPTLQFYK